MWPYLKIDVIKLRSYSIWVGPNPITVVLIKRKTRDTERAPCWSDDPTIQGTPRVVGNHQKLRERHGTESALKGEHSSANTLILDFQPPELWKNKFLLLKVTSFLVLLQPWETNTRTLRKLLKLSLSFLVCKTGDGESIHLIWLRWNKRDKVCKTVVTTLLIC